MLSRLVFIFLALVKLKNFEYFISDEDECASGANECDEHADCSNTRGSYECRCHQGFRGDGFSCRGKKNDVIRKELTLKDK